MDPTPTPEVTPEVTPETTEDTSTTGGSVSENVDLTILETNTTVIIQNQETTIQELQYLNTNVGIISMVLILVLLLSIARKMIGV